MDGTTTIASIIVLVITIPLSALLLLLTLKIFSVKDRSYGYALLVALIVGVISLLSNSFLTSAMSATLSIIVQLAALFVITAFVTLSSSRC